MTRADADQSKAGRQALRAFCRSHDVLALSPAQF